MRSQSHTWLDGSVHLWALGSFCALNRIPFDPELLLQRFPPPYTLETLIQAARALGFKTRAKKRAVPARRTQPGVHVEGLEILINQFANGLEQLMTLLIQVVGAYSLPPQNSTLCPDRDAVPRDR